MTARYKQPAKPAEWMSTAEYNHRRRVLGYRAAQKRRRRDPEKQTAAVEFASWAGSSDAAKAWEGAR
jgi:hypothetical protein